MDRQKRTIILLVGFVIQLPLIFCGIDLADMGFCSTGYAEIFSHPESVQYNYMYYLTAVVGGVWHSVMPGIVSMKFLGVLCNLFCIWMVTKLVRDWKAVLLGVFIILFGYYDSMMLFYGDLLTVVFTVTGLMLLYLSIEDQGGRGPAFWSGFVIGVSLFARLPNGAGIAYALIYMIWGFISGNRWRRSCVTWLIGWLSAVVVVTLGMVINGDFSIFMANIRDAMTMAGSKSTEATHSLGNVMSAYFRVWFEILRTAFKGLLLMGLYIWGRKSRWPLWIFVLIMVPVMLYGVRLIWSVSPTVLTAAVAVVGCAAILINRSPGTDRSKLLAIIGIMMMAVIPVGSDGGMGNNGTIVMWIALPVALSFLTLPVSTTRFDLNAGLGAVSIFTLLVGVVGMAKFVTAGPYFDDTPVWNMKGSVNAEYARGVMTSPKRAEVINDILAEVEKVTAPGDTLFVYSTGPTINYLTGTVPYIGSSWPALLPASSLKQKLETAQGHPKVVIMKFETLGSTFGEPGEEYVAGGKGNFFHNSEKSEIVAEWLKSRRYRLLTETPYIRIYE